MNIPFLSFNPMHQPLKEEMMQAFSQFYDRSWFVLGDEVKAFEQSYANFNQVGYAVGISNGLDALHIALKSLDIGIGDEIIVPSNTYIASALACSYVGAKPVFVEPRLDTYNLDPLLIEAAITSQTKAIMPVHLYGQCCQMDLIMKIAENHKLFVIEDNAQSQGASHNGKLSGSWGNINATSFYPGKNLGALGDAGAITTNDEALAKKAAVLRNYGSQKKYYNEVIGYNMRLDELQATFLSIKLKHLSDWTVQRQQIAQWYHDMLNAISDIILPITAKDCTHVYHQYIIRTNQRDALQDHLNKNGVGTLIHYPIPPHLQAAYSHLGHRKGDFPIAEGIAESCLSLPIWPGMTLGNVEAISKIVAGFF